MYYVNGPDILRNLFEAGLELVVIGGGHNNCYPIIRAAATHSGRRTLPLDVVNLDPHADCRNVAEGRHSGNGFSTAFGEGLIRKYFLCGYHNRYNSQACNQAPSLVSLFRCVH